MSIGEPRYFTGKPCPRGHISERMVSTRGCVACLSEKKAAWSAANPEKVNSQKRAWRDANLEKARALNLANQKKHRAKANERNRRYAEANREKIAARNALWEQANPHKVLAKAAKRRAAKRNQMPVWADSQQIESVYARAAELRSSGADVHVDHVIPLQGRMVSGLHVPDNLQIIEALENRVKSNIFAGD